MSSVPEELRIAVWLQEEEGTVTPESWGLARMAARLSGDEGHVTGVLLTGEDVPSSEVRAASGLDELLLLQNGAFRLYDQRAYLRAFEGSLSEDVDLFLTVSTPDGRDLMVALALARSLPCVTRALFVERTGTDVTASQEVPMGLYMQEIPLPDGRGCIAVLPGVLERGVPKSSDGNGGEPLGFEDHGPGFSPLDLPVPPASAVAPQAVTGGGRRPVPPFDEGPPPAVRRVPSEYVQGPWESRAVMPADPRTVDVAEAEFVVCAGHGVQTDRNFEMLSHVALAMGGAVGATRPVVDEGWAPFERQIGQTGRDLSGRMYLGFGVSGAVHHTAGIADCDLILAVNIDPSAPIFAVSDVGFVADALKVLAELKARLGGGGVSPSPDAGEPGGVAGR